MHEGKVTVQVSTMHEDSFHEIPEDELRRVHALPEGERKAAFYAAASPVKVGSSDEVDVCLVMDGHGDFESWEDLLEELGWDPSPTLSKGMP